MKQTYELPQIEVVELELEGVIAQSGQPELKLAVLGMQQSGKTQFLKTLQGVAYSNHLQTTEVAYDGFSVKLPNGREMKIASGTDLGGAQHFVRRYAEISKNCDAVIFVFDVYKFKNDDDYRLQTRARIEYFRDMNLPYDRKFVIGSFADKFSGDEAKAKAQDFVYSHMSDIYPNIKAQNFFMRDMRDRTQVLDICKRVFLARYPYLSWIVQGIN